MPKSGSLAGGLVKAIGVLYCLAMVGAVAIVAGGVTVIGGVGYLIFRACL